MHGHTALASFEDEEGINETLAQLLMVMEHLDDRIGPMLERDGEHFNRRWGVGGWGVEGWGGNKILVPQGGGSNCCAVRRNFDPL